MTRLNLVKATWWDSDEKEDKIQYLLINGTLEEVGTQIHEWFRDDLIEFTVRPLEEGCLVINAEFYNKIWDSDDDF